MKRYLYEFLERTSTVSILWANQYKGYLATNSGSKIGYALLNREEYLEVKQGNLRCLNSFNIPLDNLDVDQHYLSDSDLTGKHEFLVRVSKKENANELPYGVFRVYSVDEGILFKKYSNSINTPTTLIKIHNLKEEVTEFFNNPISDRKNKKGILLYGPPGNGKTSDLMSLFSLCEEYKMRIFLVDTEVRLSYLSDFQALLETGRTIFIFEEMTERINKNGMEDILTFLDGENSWNNSIVIGTTNYPKDFPENLIDRPGRFDTFIEYPNPDKQQKIELAKKFGYSEEDISQLISKDLSFDYCSFIMSQAKSKNITVSQSIKKETEKRKKISETFKSGMGIGFDD